MSLSRRVVDTKRGPSVPVMESIMSTLQGHRAICERCVADVASVEVDYVVKCVKFIRTYLILGVRNGHCPVCKRQDVTLLSLMRGAA